MGSFFSMDCEGDKSHRKRRRSRRKSKRRRRFGSNKMSKFGASSFGRRRRKSSMSPKMISQQNKMKDLGYRYRNGEFGNMSWRKVCKKHLKSGSKHKRRKSKRRSRRRSRFGGKKLSKDKRNLWKHYAEEADRKDAENAGILHPNSWVETGKGAAEWTTDNVSDTAYKASDFATRITGNSIDDLVFGRRKRRRSKKRKKKSWMKKEWDDWKKYEEKEWKKMRRKKRKSRKKFGKRKRRLGRNSKYRGRRASYVRGERDAARDIAEYENEREDDPYYNYYNSSYEPNPGSEPYGWDRPVWFGRPIRNIGL